LVRLLLFYCPDPGLRVWEAIAAVPPFGSERGQSNYYEDAELYADLAAERSIAAVRRGQKIGVEIKSFVGQSMMYDFPSALGQYIVYRDLIQLTAPEYTLYLAIDELVYAEFFQRKSVQTVTRQNQLRLIVVDTQNEEIQQWIS
jgi:hypothetical protein